MNQAKLSPKKRKKGKKKRIPTSLGREGVLGRHSDLCHFFKGELVGVPGHARIFDGLLVEVLQQLDAKVKLGLLLLDEVLQTLAKGRGTIVLLRIEASLCQRFLLRPFAGHHEEFGHVVAVPEGRLAVLALAKDVLQRAMVSLVLYGKVIALLLDTGWKEVLFQYLDIFSLMTDWQWVNLTFLSALVKSCGLPCLRRRAMMSRHVSAFPSSSAAAELHGETS